MKFCLNARILSLALAVTAPIPVMAGTTPILPAPQYDILLGAGSAVQPASAPGTYVLGNLSTTIAAAPTPSLTAYVTGTETFPQALYDRVSYSFAVVGPQDDVIVPLFVSLALHVSATGAVKGPFQVSTNASAGIEVDTIQGQIVKQLSATNIDPIPSDITGTFAIEGLSGRAAKVFLGIDVGASGEGIATAFADPFIFIDPVFLSSNPGYSIIVSEGIGNIAAVPEPATWALLLGGLLGITAVRRRAN